MKVFISADIEGITGITNWDEANKEKAPYKEFQEQMTREVLAACEGANNAGAKEIYVKDAHWTGRNIICEKLPDNVRLIRGWSGHPFSMVQEIDDSFDATIMIGYHSPADSDGNPLAHTMNNSVFDRVEINDKLVSEFHLHAYTSLYKGVPVVFVSGDYGLCLDINKFNKSIATLPVNRGVGNSTISINPNLSIKKIKEKVEKTLSADFSSCKVELPKEFNLKLRYREHFQAYKASFYPGAEKIAAKEIMFKTNDFFEVMRAILFIC